ncbi:zinc dependent phospholipase C family protein [Thermoproteota archaeon]
MQGDSHYAIAEQIFMDLVNPMFPLHKKELRDGSVYPNTLDLGFPHHHSRDKEIKEFIQQARILRIEDNPEKCIFYLGIALHYIQDRWTSLPESHEKHDLYETLIEQCNIYPWGSDLSKYYPILSEGIFEEFENYFNFFDKPPEAEKVIQMVLQSKPSESNAFLDLNLAYRISYIVTEIVLQPIKNPTLENLIKELHARYQMEIYSRDKEARRELEPKRQKYISLQKEKGIFVFIPRFFSKLKFERASNSYDKQEHLKDLFKQYQEEFNELALPYSYWYLVGHTPEFSVKEEEQLENIDVYVAQDHSIET